MIYDIVIAHSTIDSKQFHSQDFSQPMVWFSRTSNQCSTKGSSLQVNMIKKYSTIRHSLIENHGWKTNVLMTYPLNFK